MAVTSASEQVESWGYNETTREFNLVEESDPTIRLVYLDLPKWEAKGFMLHLADGNDAYVLACLRDNYSMRKEATNLPERLGHISEDAWL